MLPTVSGRKVIAVDVSPTDGKSCAADARDALARRGRFAIESDSQTIPGVGIRCSR